MELESPRVEGPSCSVQVGGGPGLSKQQEQGGLGTQEGWVAEGSPGFPNVAPSPLQMGYFWLCPQWLSSLFMLCCVVCFSH